MIAGPVTPGVPMLGRSGEDLWNIVLSRDPRFYASFVYGVTSTGIYCRPNCPARRPSQDRVRFFARAREAVHAGFRPCRRCRPEMADAKPRQVAKIERACAIIDSHPTGTLTLAELAQTVRLSPSHLQKTFRQIVGVSPKKYSAVGRWSRIRGSLRYGDSVRRAAYRSGYRSRSSLYGESRARLGMDAGTFRRGGDGLAVGYAISQSDVGRLLLAATDRGVCFVGFGESDEELLTRLRYEFPRAKIAPARGHILIEWLRRIRDAVGRSDRGLIDLPLDVRGTAFQARVWQTIRSIPSGSTATYSEIANRMGEPRATRAVARACAGNPTAVIVPCHRVVRKDGSLGGYRWGSDRKAALLRMEGEREDV